MLFQGHIFSSSPFPASQRQCSYILKHIHPGLQFNPFGSFVAVEIRNTGFAKELPKHRYVTLSSAGELQVRGNQYLSGCSTLFILLKQFLLTFNGLSQSHSVLCGEFTFFNIYLTVSDTFPLSQHFLDIFVPRITAELLLQKFSKSQ